MESVSGLVLTFPILAGKVEAWRRFCQELSGSRRRQFEDSRQRLGITHEQMALLETPYGATAVTTLEALDIAQAFGLLITSDRSFDVWYRERLHELHGVNLVAYERYTQPIPPRRYPEVQFEWRLIPNEIEDLHNPNRMVPGKEKDDERQQDN